MIPQTDLLEQWKARDVEISLRGDDISVRFLDGILTEVDVDDLRYQKPRIVAALRARDGVGRTRGADPTSRVRGAERAAGNKSQNLRKTAATVDHDVSANSANIAARIARGTINPARAESAVRSVTIDDRTFPFSLWDGELVGDDLLGFDTETAPIQGHEVPELALASASSGDEHRLIHPDRVGDFIRAHAERRFVFHNVAFDFWVVHEHLSQTGKRKALKAWRRIVDEDRMHDTMLLDQLIRLARTDADPEPRNLGVVAREYAGLEIDKSDPFRRRYGEIIGRDWSEVDPGFFRYAIKDPIATRLAYQAMEPMAVGIMEEYGHDPARRP